MMHRILPNRKEAGRRLAAELIDYSNHPQAIVLGLPRGGVPVAYEIANQLNLPLDVCLVRKLGLPSNPEVAVGAIAEAALLPDYNGNITIIDQNTAQMHGVEPAQIEAIAAKEQAELRWRDRCYRHFRPMLEIRDRIVILVDDGMATGLTMHAAVTAVRKQQPEKIILAIPVASTSAIEQLKTQTDAIICLITPEYFSAVGFWYEDFTQVSDRQVCDLLSQETHNIVN
ncbi:MAG TPA: phosphoribosyltransferase [Xenococcaceae cyanobacterium]|jgi:putative phosphoribosyl transferase